MEPWQYSIPFVGAIALEVFHWYQLRTRLKAAKYRQLLRSPAYWVITVLTVIMAGVLALILYSEDPEPVELLIAGAALPTLFKKLVSGFVASAEVKLGDEDQKSHPVLDYFSVG